ncbi:MAG: imelysin family protein [Oceanococcus sp.]
MKIFYSLMIATLAIALSSCDEAPLADNNAINLHIAEEIIEPAFAKTAAASEQLATNSAALCAAFNAANLAITRQAWKDTWFAWQAASIFTFGPLSEEARLRIEFFPDDRDLVESRSEDFLQDPSVELNQLSAPVQGLPALEYLLFSPRDQRQVICPAVSHIGEFLNNSLQSIHQAWPDYIEQNFALSDSAGLTQLVESVIREVVSVRDDELGRPLGNNNGNAALPQRVSSPYAEQSLNAIVAELNGIEQLFRGEGGPALGYRIRSLGGGVYEDDVLALIGQTRNGLDSIDSALVTAVTQATSRAQLYQVYDGAFAQLRNQIQDLGGAVGVVPGFNANDGD